MEDKDQKKYHKKYPKLTEEMENIIEDQVWKAEEENDKQIKRYFNQEKGYINFGLKDFEEHLISINFEDNEENEKRESMSSGLNILNFENDAAKRKEFYQASKLMGEMWQDDAIILEGSLKYLQIIQDSLSDKLPKIIHHEIFESTQMFVKEELYHAMMDVWKQNKEKMFSDENRREQKQKLENDIESNQNALEIVNRMTKIIKSFKNQHRHYDQSDDETDEDDFNHLGI